MRRTSWQLRVYRGLTWCVPLVAPAVLRRRLLRGKEDPERWTEKRGEASVPRPEGPLVWMHAVGLGEVMALRGLIAAMRECAPGLNFLVTSTARSGAEVFARSGVPGVVHQYLPLDAPSYLDRFLRHWSPDVSIWAEQDVWPGAVHAADQAGIPLAMVNARMNAASLRRRSRLRGLYADVLARFHLISAQDDETARHLAALGARTARVDGPLKAAAPPLPADPEDLETLRRELSGKPVWLLASSHPEDEAVALSALRQDEVLIIAPRDPARGAEILAAARALGAKATLRSVVGNQIDGRVYIADSFGELGLWYRLADRALIGGTFGATEGHNPWEAAALGCAILHGPRTANFAADYAILDNHEGARLVDAATLRDALDIKPPDTVGPARALVVRAREALTPLAQELVGMIR